MSPFDRHLEYIGSCLTIKDEDRQRYTENFDQIRDYVLSIMRSYDSDFNMICKSPSLFGSFSNNVRICFPSEFDVLVKLSFPYSTYIQVEEDDDRPGYVNLNFIYVLEKLEENGGYEDMYELLKEDLVDSENGYLRRSNLQRWIQNILIGALNEYGNIVFGAKGELFKLEYSKRGLAHTIYARGPWYNISIDLVPAIMFGQTEWMDIRNQHPFKNKCDLWYALPKPAFGPKMSRRYAFMICNPKVEHDLLLGRQNLKVVFRLLKSLRNNYGMTKLKSYFITTTFLWEIENQPEDFWYKPVGNLFIHMLGVLCDFFLEGRLPFFWNEELDLLDRLDFEKITEYGEQLRLLYNVFITYPHQPQLSLERCESYFKMP